MLSPTSMLIEANGLRFNVLDWGAAGKPPLFLLHGLASRAHMFDLLAPELANRFHVFAFDQRGHGLSDKPSDGYDFETISSDLDQIVDALGFGSSPVPMVGHSWGAYTALYYAATRPQRTARIALIDGGIRPLQHKFPTWADAEIGMSPPQYSHMNLDNIRRFIREEWIGNALRPDMVPLALSVFDQSDPNNIQPYLSRENHLKIAYHLWAFNPADYYPRVRCPALIVNAVSPGEEIDPLMQSYAQAAVEAIKQVEVVWMRDTIHDIPWHRPIELAEILNRFLP